MAAGVPLDRAIEAVGHKRATCTRDVVSGLRALGVGCAERLRRVTRKRPALPRRCIVAIHRPPSERRCERWHWMLSWDGEMLDPGNRWPEFYRDWIITSYLEIYS